MFARTKRVRFTMVVAFAAAAALLNSCGGKKTAQTQSQREAQAASSRGFETVTTPTSELEKIKRDLEDRNIPCGIGIGESTDEQIARSTSTDQARTDVATSIDAQVQRLSESYAQNVNGEAKKIWEEGVRQLTNQHLRGIRSYKEVVQYNPENNRYKIYTLVVLDPKLFKEAIIEATARDEELELRVKKDDMMKKLDANIAEYDNKYRGK